MRPVLFHLVGVPWFSWHIFFALGAVCSFFAFTRLARRSAPGISAWNLFGIFTGTYVWIFAGAAMWAVWIEGFPPLHDQLSRFDSFAMSSSGGIVGGIFAFVVISSLTGASLAGMADAAVPAAMLGFSIGRVGCFMNGDDYGKVLPAAWVRLPDWLPYISAGSPLRYPVQLTESLFCLVAFIVLVAMRPRRAGGIAAWGVLFYSSMRLVTENFRGDWRGPALLLPAGIEISPPQSVALVGLVTSAAFLILLQKQTTREPVK